MLYRIHSPGRALALALTALSISMAAPSPGLASPAASAGRPTPPTALVLHVKDLPSSYKGFTEQGIPIDNINEANGLRVNLATVTKYGRITGYETAIGNRDKKHPLSIQDEVSLFRSTAGAHSEYRQYSKAYPPMSRSKRLNMSGIGDEGYGYFLSGAAASNLYTFSTAGVYFRRGVYDARIYILGYTTVHPGDVLQLARTLDGRLKHAR